ncbi:hypothetical protein [Mycolicibacterium madagascariense]|uniref:hypothetical protein n=1 Tax=Mycolicibacterium madagascariense TaxID=212765 RepID=UPI0013D50EEA|nr:hypothetical protein [Mycolicibacterium madagascariense]MCV7015561.1 hypothetical protein [Mycolicibacterium madagascariense]
MTTDEDRPIRIPYPDHPDYGRVLDELGIICIAQDIPRWTPDGEGAAPDTD